MYRKDKTMEDLIRIMTEVRPDIDFATATTLIDDNMIDSLNIISIVTEVNDFFGIEINVNDLVPENFNSAAALYELVEKLQNE